MSLEDGHKGAGLERSATQGDVLGTVFGCRGYLLCEEIAAEPSKPVTEWMRESGTVWPNCRFEPERDLLAHPLVGLDLDAGG